MVTASRQAHPLGRGPYVAAAILAAAVGLPAAACTGSGHPVPSPRPSSRPSTASPHVAGTIPLPSAPAGISAAATSDGQVWLTAPGGPSAGPRVGQLLGIGTTAKQLTSRTDVGGEPVAVAASGSAVWAANGQLDPHTPVSAANTVYQLDRANATVRYRYRVAGPVAVAAGGAGRAWVLTASPTGTQPGLALLSDGAVVRSLHLPGSLAASPGRGSPLTSCDGTFAVAVSAPGPGDLDVQERDLATGALQRQWSIPAAGPPILACQPGLGLFAAVSSVTGGGIFMLPGSGAARRLPGSPATMAGLGATPGVLWAITQPGPGQPSVAMCFSHALQVIGRVQLPAGSIGPATPAGQRFWVVDGDQLVGIAA